MTMNNKPRTVFIDTNILIRFSIPTAPQHQEIRQAINKLWGQNIQLWISRQITREFGAVITRPQSYANPLTSADASKQIKLLPQSFFK